MALQDSSPQALVDALKLAAGKARQVREAVTAQSIAMASLQAAAPAPAPAAVAVAPSAAPRP